MPEKEKLRVCKGSLNKGVVWNGTLLVLQHEVVVKCYVDITRLEVLVRYKRTSKPATRRSPDYLTRSAGLRFTLRKWPGAQAVFFNCRKEMGDEKTNLHVIFELVIAEIQCYTLTWFSFLTSADSKGEVDIQISMNAWRLCWVLRFRIKRIESVNPCKSFLRFRSTEVILSALATF